MITDIEARNTKNYLTGAIVSYTDSFFKVETQLRNYFNSL